MDEHAVPESVRLVRDFVNSREPQTGAESLDSPERLRDWLADSGLLRGETKLTTPDLERATTIREGLRSVLLSHAGHDADAGAVAALNDALRRVPVRLSFDVNGFRLDAAGTEFESAMARLLDAVRESSEDQTWPRLKVCARDTCRWAFYDSSRNQSRLWCSMAGCGNYVKMHRRSARDGGTRGDD